jgi:hypothetical protein
MALHQAMINSIGALNLSTIERLSGHAGILSLTCQQLLGRGRKVVVVVLDAVVVMMLLG